MCFVYNVTNRHSQQWQSTREISDGQHQTPPVCNCFAISAHWGQYALEIWGSRNGVTHVNGRPKLFLFFFFQISQTDNYCGFFTQLPQREQQMKKMRREEKKKMWQPQFELSAFYKHCFFLIRKSFVFLDSKKMIFWKKKIYFGFI